MTTTPRILDRLVRDPAAERESLLAALLAPRASIAPKYFYDALGCALFGAICELPEYYPTRTEQAIFDGHRQAIAARTGRALQLVDLGAGDGRKAQQWFAALAPRRYVAVDIAPTALETTLARVAREAPYLEAVGVVTDFTAGLDLFADLSPLPTLFFYPGSSIGNFAPEEAVRFLAEVRAHCARAGAGSGLLIGVDLKKDRALLDAAYDDAAGVTAAFNRNMLRHVNAVLGADFDLRAFAHVAFYAPEHGRIEMHLEALRAQTVHLGARTRTFAAGERIATEHSYKYTPAEFAGLLARAGFARQECWRDERDWFAVYYAS